MEAEGRGGGVLSLVFGGDGCTLYGWFPSMLHFTGDDIGAFCYSLIFLIHTTAGIRGGGGVVGGDFILPSQHANAGWVERVDKGRVRWVEE